MNLPPARCLVLACGNTLREDDGIGPFLAAWAEQRFVSEPAVRVLATHQWTPELALDIAAVETVLFVDCAANAAPGAVAVTPVLPATEMPRLMTHHLDAPALLALAHELYNASPRQSLMLTVGAGSLELREAFSDAVQAAIPETQHALESAVRSLLAQPI